MSELNITPGPWVIGDDDYLHEVSSSEGVVCQMYEYGEIKPAKRMRNAEANARLIAAAPELLDACQQLLSLTPDYTNPEAYCRLVRHLSKAAIEKATKG